MFMKKFFFSAFISVFCFAVQVSAQSSVIATLFHDGDIQTFYGTGALRQAHDAAAHGDVITLSSGMFTGTDITKAITLRGAGMEYDSISITEPTIISGDFTIAIPNDSTLQNHNLVMEGIYHNTTGTMYVGTYIYNPQFVKCRFYTISSNSSNAGEMYNANFINCIIARYYSMYSKSSATFVNCYIEDPCMSSPGSYTFEFQNCVIKSWNFYNLHNSIYRNCFIYGAQTSSSNYNAISSTSAAYNCVGISRSLESIFENQFNTSNIELSTSDWANVFKTWTGGSIADFRSERLELTDEAKAKYLGNDGTQVGIYGGSIPFEARPSNPQITKLNVASKSTADGKLSVDIEVKAAE